MAVAILVAAPLLFFGIPGFMGHPVLNGDNLYQNLPMRTLAGDQLRQGTFPLFNPYIWSGSPLLGGWNAGAMYPFTFLFAVLPATAAWVLNEMLVYWVAALGLYLFLRASGLRPVAGLLGAASFAFAGSMASQMVHFGVVAGMSLVPLMLARAAGALPTPDRERPHRLDSSPRGQWGHVRPRRRTAGHRRGGDHRHALRGLANDPDRPSCDRVPGLGLGRSGPCRAPRRRPSGCPA